jgi:hypothetical protein
MARGYNISELLFSVFLFIEHICSNFPFLETILAASDNRKYVVLQPACYEILQRASNLRTPVNLLVVKVKSEEIFAPLSD